MLRNCRVCNKQFDYCPTCEITKNLFKRAGYCGEDCYHISLILQKFSCNDATVEETANALKYYNIETKTLKASIQTCYQDVLDFIKKEEVIPVEDVEVVIENNKDMTIS